MIDPKTDSGCECATGVASITDPAIVEAVRRALSGKGIDFECCPDRATDSGDDPCAVKVVCVSPNLNSSVEEVGQSNRDQVVMVRVDGATSRALDDWVAAGAVRSRSEAAAVFIREGLKVRQGELDQLRDALNEVERAKIKLQKKAREVFGPDDQG